MFDGWGYAMEDSGLGIPEMNPDSFGDGVLWVGEPDYGNVGPIDWNGGVSDPPAPVGGAVALGFGNEYPVSDMENISYLVAGEQSGVPSSGFWDTLSRGWNSVGSTVASGVKAVANKPTLDAIGGVVRDVIVTRQTLQDAKARVERLPSQVRSEFNRAPQDNSKPAFASLLGSGGAQTGLIIGAAILAVFLLVKKAS